MKEERLTTNCGKLPVEKTLSDTISGDEIHVKYVKEFIQKLKEDLCQEYYERKTTKGLDRIPQLEILEKIDKHAGKYLVEGKE